MNMTRRSVIGASRSVSSQQSCQEEREEEDVVVPPTQILKIRPNNNNNDDNDDDDENDSQVSSVSSLSEDDSSRLTSPQSSKPRAIFDRYWKAEGTTPSRKLCPPRSSSPMCVMADPYSYRPPYPYDSEMALLWLEEEANSRPENDADSLNTYERTLNNCEVLPHWRVQQRMFSPYMNAPLWLSWFGKTNASAPTLHRGGNLSLARQVQSDSALHVKPLRSVLRQGRFSQKTTTATSSSTNTTTKTTNNAHHVHFQPRIQVCSYELPLENWAEQGWSQWFGS